MRTAIVLAILVLCATARAKEPAPLDRERSAAVEAELTKQGWARDDERESDRGLLDLRPQAFVRSSAAAKNALRSRSFGGESLGKLRGLLHAAIDPELRALALDALIDSPDERADPLLVELYGGVREPSDRARILARLDPANPDAAGFDLLLREAKGSTDARIRAAARRQLATLRLRFGKSPDVLRRRLESLPAELRRLPDVALPIRTTGLEEEDDAPEIPCDAAPAAAKTPTIIRRAESGPSPEDYPIEREPDPRTTLPGKPGATPRPPVPGRTPTVVHGSGNALPEDPTKAGHTFWKVRADGTFATPTASEIAQPGRFRQVVIFPAGYTAEERDKFHDDARRMICNMATLDERVFTSKHRERLVYVVAWRPGGELGTTTANFGAELFDHPTRGGKGMTLENRAVIETVKKLGEGIRTLAPIGVFVVFDYSKKGITAFASPPTFLRNDFGIVRISRYETKSKAKIVGVQKRKYVPMHELGHSGLNFLDEYVESTLRDVDVSWFDHLTPYFLFDGTASGLEAAWNTLIHNYSIRVSEILADNGSSNVSTREYPATVVGDDPPYDPYRFRWQGGMFFGFGTRHQNGDNVMNNDKPCNECDEKPDGNRFDWKHNRVQRDVIDQVFDPENRARRPNDRLRNAGPVAPQASRKVRLLLHDGDKNHRWHPTKEYVVKVRWYELDLSDCPAKACIPGSGFDGFACAKELGVAVLGLEIPATCNPTKESNWKARTMKKSFAPTPSTVHLDRTLLPRFLEADRRLIFDVLSAVGIQEVESGGDSVNLAETVSESMEQLLPFVVWPTPYQEVTFEFPKVPAVEFEWKFKTDNGTYKSPYTSYSPILVAPLD